MTERGERRGSPAIPLQGRLADANRVAVGPFQVQVQVLVRRGNGILLVGTDCGGAWAVPAVWVHAPETVPDTIDRLIAHLGLSRYQARLAATTVCRLPDGTEVTQLSFDIGIVSETEASWPNGMLWWRTHTEPPKRHHPSRPVLELLFGIPPTRAI